MIRNIVQMELLVLDYWMLAGQDAMADIADDAAPGPSSSVEAAAQPEHSSSVEAAAAQPEHAAAQPNLLL